MAMTLGSGGPKSDINVTPLIDIVLVLLIIFMVLTPLMQRGYDLSIPEKATEKDQPPSSADQLILLVEPNPGTEEGIQIKVNNDVVALTSLQTKLEDQLRLRKEKIVFFQCDDAVVYQKAIDVMDAIRAAGGIVGLVTTEIKPAT